MSEASKSAHVRITIADYAVVDQQGKATIVGGGVTILGVNVQTGMTAPFAVFVSVSFAPHLVGQDPAVELSLETDDQQLVQMPGPLDPSAEPQYLRVATSDKLPPTLLPGLNIPVDLIRPKAQMLLHFQNGLPLAPGRAYTWRVKVDSDTRPEWTEMLYIPTASTGPVHG
jgi:hypothetical protein